MHCPECGVELGSDVLFCPECGANPYRQPIRRSGCRRALPLVWAIIAVFLAVAVFGLAVWRGTMEGRKQWQVNAEATADAEFVRCQQYQNEEKWALAAAACRQALSLKPGYSPAAEGYATAVAALTPQPTPTVQVTERPIEDVFIEADERFAAQDWRAALETLNELWTFDPTYRAEEVNTMRRTALISLGRQSLDEGRLEEGIFYLDQATAFGALEPDLELERQFAARYVSALNLCGVDWDECTSRLTVLYTTNPSYRDVFAQLLNAYLDWAEMMASIQEWCPAEVHYSQYLRLLPDADVEAKRADAAEGCLLATPTPVPGQVTDTLKVTIEGFNVGRLAYSAYNKDLGVYEVYVLSAHDQSLSKFASSAGQPNWRRDGGLLTYRGVPGVQAMPTSGGGPFTLVNDPSAFWPTLSPDGSRVAYARQDADGWRIYVASTDGSAEPQAVTVGKYPVWGPHGVLAFSGCLVDGTARGVCAIDPNDANALPVPLTANPNDTPVSWSPDGGNIAYMSDHGGDWDVYLVNTAGGVVLLTQDDDAPASDGLPAWSPDGSTIAFASNRGGVWDLYLMSRDGSNVRKMLEIGAQHPNWRLERLSWAP